MMRWVACFASTAALLSASEACAQAFTQPAGQGRVIASVMYSDAERGFDDDAHVQDIPDYITTSVYLLGEYGVTDDLTLLATPSFRDVDVQGGDDDAGLGFTDLGARYRLVNSGDAVFSVQGLVRVPGQTRRENVAQIGQTDVEFDVRGQGGFSFGQGSFAILEGGYRFRTGEPPNEFKLDGTLGVRVAPRTVLLASSYNTISDGRGRGVFTRYRYHNLYFSAAQDVSPNVTLQLGVQGTLAGRNALRERGFFGGVWFRF